MINGTPRIEDRAESIALMEPMRLSEDSRFRGELMDMALDLAQKSAGFRRSLPPGLLTALATLVRSMNCYYSNLIEGHDTHPVDIDRALNGEYSKDAHKRDLQLEARAHIAVQSWIDEGGLNESGQPAGMALSEAAIREVHRRFCELLPEEILWVEDPITKERIRVLPGELRTRDVQVGRHVAISPGAVPRFLERFEHAYGSLGKSELILSAAASHHRLVWIHPFADGNGRVARLISHALLLDVLNTGAVWSIARGFARNMGEYKKLLAECDQPKRNELDGRGNLSEEALVQFTRFFLKTAIDQVVFMEQLMQPEQLRARILLWAEEEINLGKLPPKSGVILEAVLYRGELPRAEIVAVIGTGERQAQRIVAALVKRGVLNAASSRAPLRLKFSATLGSRWMPGLFPEKIGYN